MEEKVAAVHFTLKSCEPHTTHNVQIKLYFYNNFPCANESVYAKCEVLRSLLYVFMSFVFWALGEFLIT